MRLTDPISISSSTFWPSSRQPVHRGDVLGIPLARTDRAFAVARLDQVVYTLLRKHVVAALARNDTILPLCWLHRALEPRLEGTQLFFKQLVACVYDTRRFVIISNTRIMNDYEGRNAACTVDLPPLSPLARLRKCSHFLVKVLTSLQCTSVHVPVGSASKLVQMMMSGAHVSILFARLASLCFSCVEDSDTACNSFRCLSAMSKIVLSSTSFSLDSC